jgi:hypothetical protein
MAPSLRTRRPLVILSAVVIAVSSVMFLVVSGGSNNSRAQGGSNPFSPPPPHASPSMRPHSPSFAGRDPFRPPGTVPSPVPTGSPTPTPTISPAGSPPPGPGGGSSTTIGGHTVVLDDVFTVSGVVKAQVEVDGVVYTVAPGQRFDGNFKLVRIQGSCGAFLFGDQDFTLCGSVNK